MAAFFNTQLDFIFFFYGLAFILLGSICLSIARGRSETTPLLMLAAFAFIHGLGEWLDLAALIAGDTYAFAIARTGVMTVSFICLVEFARLQAIHFGFKAPGRWIFLPLLMLVAWGAHLSGLNGANALARYALGFTGATATGVVMAIQARRDAPAERWWLWAGVLGFALYAVAGGLVVPPTENWEGDFFNYDTFAHFTGTPIQFVRGVLACWIAFSVWGYWGQRLMRAVDDARYSKFMRRQFVWTLAAMGATLMFGWILTEYLGGIYKRNVEEQARGDVEMIYSRLTSEMAAADGTVRILAGSRALASLLINGDVRFAPRVQSVLQLDSEVAGARNAYVLDRNAKVVASYSSTSGERKPADDIPTEPYFTSALSGQPGSQFEVAARGRTRDYYASYPVHDDSGDIVGVAVLRKSLDAFETGLKEFDVGYYLIDSNGIIVATNRPADKLRTLWPLPAETVAALGEKFGTINTKPMLKQETSGAVWTTLDGARDYVQRLPIGTTGWSLAIATSPQGIFASRVLGIIITLQMATLALVYLVGRERWVHDNVQLQKRIDLEELARNLDYHAATDPLTGLFNRRKFDRELAIEMIRAQRYKTPLSLIMFDLDRFKDINDKHGHQAGDNVLITLSGFVAGRIRQSDIFARWGGEEFVILVPGCTADMTFRMVVALAADIRGHALDPVGNVTCSYGVAEFNAGDTAETLIARADGALYRAKMNGRDRVELAEPTVAAPDLAPAE